MFTKLKVGHISCQLNDPNKVSNLIYVNVKSIQVKNGRNTVVYYDETVV